MNMMMLVTVKPKFQVTIPAKLRKRMRLKEGDVMEAILVEDGVLLRPKAVVDRNSTSQRIASLLARIEPSSEDVGRSEEEIMQVALADVARVRGERRELNP